MSIKIKSVYPTEDLNVIVFFENGVAKKYDVKPLVEKFVWFRDLEYPDLFAQVHVDCGGCGIAWNEDIDISECELWECGVPYSTPFDGLISFSEAAGRWGIDDSTLRKAVTSGRLIENIDVKKFGKQWVRSETAMKRLFGNEKTIPKAV